MMAFSLLAGPSVAFVRLFDLREVESRRNDFPGEVVRYRLFTPRNAEPVETFPLIVWLHGYQERGNDGVAHLRWLDQFVFTDANCPDKYRFYLLALQLPKSESTWYRSTLKANGDPAALEADMLAVLKGVVDGLLEKCPIDPNRVTVTGVSLGAGACWEYAIRYPDQVAAIAPLSGPGGAIESMERLKDVPIWAFNCNRDPSSPLANVERRVEAVNTAGGYARLTIVESDEHDAWTKAFRDYELLAWLLSQDRSKPKSRSWWLSLRLPPYLDNWTLGELAAQAALLIGLAAFTIGALRICAKTPRRQGRNGGDAHPTKGTAA